MSISFVEGVFFLLGVLACLITATIRRLLKHRYPLPSKALQNRKHTYVDDTRRVRRGHGTAASDTTEGGGMNRRVEIVGY